MESKSGHLSLVQSAVGRMAGNSFMLKGWAVTLVAALFALAAKDADRALVVIAWVPLLVFAGLDSYYLWQEKLFRQLYHDVASKPAVAVDFSMDIEPYKQKALWRNALASPTIWGFYGPLAGLLLLVTLYLVIWPPQPPVPVQGPKTITISIQ